MRRQHWPWPAGSITAHDWRSLPRNNVGVRSSILRAMPGPASQRTRAVALIFQPRTGGIGSCVEPSSRPRSSRGRLSRRIAFCNQRLFPPGRPRQRPAGLDRQAARRGGPGRRGRAGRAAKGDADSPANRLPPEFRNTLPDSKSAIKQTMLKALKHDASDTLRTSPQWRKL